MRIFFFTIIFLIAQLSYSQESINGSSFKGDERKKKDLNYTCVGGAISFSQYFGDLNPLRSSNFFKPKSSDVGLTGYLTNRFSSHFEWSTELSWLRLTADDYYSSDPLKADEIRAYTRNLSFRNDLVELNAQLRYFFIKNPYTHIERPVFSPYVFIGVGIVYQCPKARIPEFNQDSERNPDFGKWQPLRPLGTEGQFSEHYNVKPYSYIQPVIPAGIGLNFRVNAEFDVGFELSYRYLFTDYIDDVGGNYVDLGALDSDLARSFSDRSREINSSNGRYPRDFESINNFTQPYVYVSKYNDQSYQVFEGFGNQGNPRGSDSHNDFYLLTSIKISYIVGRKKEK